MDAPTGQITMAELEEEELNALLEIDRLRGGITQALTSLHRGRTVGGNWQVQALLAENQLSDLLNRS